MDYHHHARLTIYSREQLARNVVERRLSLRERPPSAGSAARAQPSGCAVIASREGMG